MQQNEVLTQDYNQLEEDFNELLKEKERLEGQLGTDTDGQSMAALIEERDLLLSSRDQFELTIQVCGLCID